MGYFHLVMIALMVLFVTKILQVCRILLWRPYVVTKSFKKQGITGPGYSIISGSLNEMKKLTKVALETVLDTNSHDITNRVIPYYSSWFSEYGETFLYWYGIKPRICISDPEVAKHVLSSKFGFYFKPQLRPIIETLAGKGLALINGEDWVSHRKIINPAFTIDKLKVMIRDMAECTISMLDEWKNQAMATEDQCKTIEMQEEFKNLSADVIAHTAFGSSFAEGREAFKAQAGLQKCCAASFSDIFIPGSQYLPTPSNIEIWKLDRKVRKTLRSIIESRLKAAATGISDGYGDDLLGVMIEASEMVQTSASSKLNMNEIMEECKAFFFAGHETTANWLTWTVYLLSVHQEWQSKLRKEVLEYCDTGIPDADILSKLKLVNMVLLEALRLYSPVIQLYRQGSEDMKLGKVMIPKDTWIVIPVFKIQRDKRYWGDDADEFNPLRFINGVTKAAKNPNAMLAFGAGPRACIGQTFAMLEAKTTIALILQKFSFSLSPDYKHTPVDNLILHPQCGLPVIVKPLC